MTIDEVVALARTVHDAEGWNLGAGSTRETRNQFWARAIGIVHHGHPTYNPHPDRQWHIKDGGNGRPQSDDVVVQMPSRYYWDCIPSAGANGYSFHASFDGVLPADQNVYAPPVPEGTAPNPQQPTPSKPMACQFVAVDLAPIANKLDALVGVVVELAVKVGHLEGRTPDAQLLAEIRDVRKALKEGLAIEMHDDLGGWGRKRGTLTGKASV